MPATSTRAAARKRTPRGALAPRPAVARSRVSNGTDGTVLPGCDQRSAIARRYRDLCSLMAADAGGADRCSETKLQLIRRFAALAVQAEQLEAKLAAGEQIDVSAHAHISSTLVRLASRIGVSRVAKNATPSLREYLQSRTVEAEPA